MHHMPGFEIYAEIKGHIHYTKVLNMHGKQYISWKIFNETSRMLNVVFDEFPTEEEKILALASMSYPITNVVTHITKNDISRMRQFCAEFGIEIIRENLDMIAMCQKLLQYSD